MPGFGEGYRFHITGLVHDETGFPTNSMAIAKIMNERIIKKVENNVEDIIQYEETDVKDCDILILTYGGPARTVTAAKKMAAEKGIKVGVFRLITIWPFPEKAFKACVRNNKIKKVLVAELNYGQIVYEAERVLKEDAQVSHIGKVDGDILYPGEVLDKISEVIKNG
jgi:2-oxoglutarate ferredoxin oxidoreductase subunit alpha